MGIPMPTFAGGTITTAGMAGGLGSAAGDLLGTLAGGAFGAAAADKAWRRQKKVLQNQISWRVSDLRNAGLNPILAARGALGGGGGAVPMAQQFMPSSLGSRAVQSAKETALLRKQGDVMDTQVDLNTANTAKGFAAAFRDQMLGGVATAQKEKTRLESLGQEIMNSIQRKNLAVADMEAANAANLAWLIKEYPWISAVERYGPSAFRMLESLLNIRGLDFPEDPAGTHGLPAPDSGPRGNPGRIPKPKRSGWATPPPEWSDPLRGNTKPIPRRRR